MDDIPSALLVGKSGAGKSSFGNRLLFDCPRPDEGFRSAGGRDPVTSKCESKSVASTPGGGPLRVVDTPGIPDPKGRTMEFFDDIVRSVRGAGGLNALFVVVHYDVDRHHIQEDSETLSLILRQFGKLPCLKVLLCRVAIEDGLTETQQENDMTGARTWATTIAEKGGLETAEVVFLQQNSGQQSQVRGLREMVYGAPKVPTRQSGMRTYGELEESEKQLAALERRAKGLRAEKGRLECEEGQLEPRCRDLVAKKTKAKARGSAVRDKLLVGPLVDVFTCALTMGTFTVAAVAAGAAQMTYEYFAIKRYDRKIKKNNSTRSGIVAKVKRIDSELETVAVIQLPLQKDVKTLNELRELKNVTA